MMLPEVLSHPPNDNLSLEEKKESSRASAGVVENLNHQAATEPGEVLEKGVVRTVICGTFESPKAPAKARDEESALHDWYADTRVRSSKVQHARQLELPLNSLQSKDPPVDGLESRHSSTAIRISASSVALASCELACCCITRTSCAKWKPNLTTWIDKSMAMLRPDRLSGADRSMRGDPCR